MQRYVNEGSLLLNCRNISSSSSKGDIWPERGAQSREGLPSCTRALFRYVQISSLSGVQLCSMLVSVLRKGCMSNNISLACNKSCAAGKIYSKDTTLPYLWFGPWSPWHACKDSLHQKRDVVRVGLIIRKQLHSSHSNLFNLFNTANHLLWCTRCLHCRLQAYKHP